VILVIVVWITGEHSYIFDYDYCQTGSKAYGHAVWGGTWANLSMQNVKFLNISTTASALVPKAQSPAQPSPSLPSGQQPSTYQTPPTQQQQNPQMAPSQVQQSLGICRVSTHPESEK